MVDRVSWRSLHRTAVAETSTSPWRIFTHHESTVSSLHRTAEASIADGGLLKHVYYVHSMNTVSYPHCTAEASIAGGGPSKHKCYLSSLNTVSLHSGSKHRQWRARRSCSCRASSVDAFKTRTLAGPHRASDSTHSVFLHLTMYADPLAERV